MSEQQISVILQRVMFDPLSYIHPLRFQAPPYLVGNASERAAVNELLIEAFQLEIDHINIGIDSLTRRWLRQWYQLPQVAYLIGCYSQRGNLAWQGGILELPKWSQNFINIELPNKTSTCQMILSHSDLLQIGYTQLELWSSQLPEPLSQRYTLMFPPRVETKLAVQQTTDLLILTLALQYAQKYPNKLPTDTN